MPVCMSVRLKLVFFIILKHFVTSFLLNLVWNDISYYSLYFKLYFIYSYIPCSNLVSRKFWISSYRSKWSQNELRIDSNEGFFGYFECLLWKLFWFASLVNSHIKENTGSQVTDHNDIGKSRFEFESILFLYQRFYSTLPLFLFIYFYFFNSTRIVKSSTLLFLNLEKFYNCLSVRHYTRCSSSISSNIQ